MQAQYKQYVEAVLHARNSKSPLDITGSGSKRFYGRGTTGSPLSMLENTGIVEYDPAELVIVARTGTSLEQIQQTLAEKGQMLGFEPPFVSAGATLGGAVASGLAGPSRPYRGGIRDYMLGAKILNGKGDVMQFGGRVMKNVAGFDLFRPMAGSMGTLAVLLEASLRVIPITDAEITLSILQEDQGKAIKLMSELGQTLRSLSACAWYDNQLTIRLSGSTMAIERDQSLLAAYSPAESASSFWHRVNNFDHEFFHITEDNQSIIAIDVPPAALPINVSENQLVDWSGARRYLNTKLELSEVQSIVSSLGGKATRLMGGDRSIFSQPLSEPMMALHQRLKQTFDPDAIFNSGRMYSQL